MSGLAVLTVRAGGAFVTVKTPNYAIAGKSGRSENSPGVGYAAGRASPRARPPVVRRAVYTAPSRPPGFQAAGPPGFYTAPGRRWPARGAPGRRAGRRAGRRFQA